MEIVDMPKKKNASRSTSIYFKPEELAILERLCVDTGFSASRIVGYALRELSRQSLNEPSRYMMTRGDVRDLYKDKE